jgi:SAM-dependent methyltransferase
VAVRADPVSVCNLCAESFAVDRQRRWHKDGFDIVQCPRCGLLFRAALPTRDELTLIYAESYFSRSSGDSKGQGYLDYLADEHSHRETARRRLRLLERHVPPGSLLDVGAAAGFFVDEARRSGWDALGVDVAEPMVAWGRRTLGLELVLGEIDEAIVPADSLDAVTMWDYIEHSRDPRRDVEAAHRLLRPGGILALSTGDIDAAFARLTRSRWHLLTPRHHNFFFTRRTLQQLLERSEFAVRSVSYPGARYPLAYVFHKLRTLADVAALRSAVAALERSPLGGVRIPVNLRDIVTIVARKELSREGS